VRKDLPGKRCRAQILALVGGEPLIPGLSRKTVPDAMFLMA